MDVQRNRFVRAQRSWMKSCRISIIRKLPGLLVLLLTALPLMAQSAGLQGVVLDPSESSVPGASVEAININTQIRRVAETDEQGNFTIPSIPDGTYQVTTRARGFSTHLTNDVVITNGKSQTLNIKLAIRAVATEVTVQATIANIPDTDIDVGPLVSKKLIDLPYAITVLPSDLIENQQASSLRELIKYMPSAQIQERGGSDVGRPQTRGFQGDVTANTRYDGMNIVTTTSIPMEMFDRIEVINGLSGSMNGPTPPSGSFNFVIKRAPDAPLRRITLKYDNQNSPSILGDLGQKFGKDKQFGYRLTAVFNDGEGYVDGSSLRRGLVSMAFDWRFLKNTVAELNFSYYAFEKKGYSAGFGYGDAAPLPEPMDASVPGYGQKWAGHELYTNTESLRIRHDFNDNWHLTAGVLDQHAERGMLTVNNTMLDNNGNFRTSVSPGVPSAWEVTSNIAYLNGSFRTGSVLHEIAFGTNGHQRRMVSGQAVQQMPSVTLGTSNIAAPRLYDYDPAWSAHLDYSYKSSINQQQMVLVNDTLTFDRHWSAVVSFGQAWIWTRGFNNSGNETSRRDDNGVSLGASLLYKPVEKVTTYYTYADSLEMGAVAPSLTANPNIQNPGEAMAPYRSKSHEVGVKAEFSSRASFTIAGFHIERPFAFTDPRDAYFKVAGNQRNLGLEISATGDILQDLTVYGGLTVMDPKLRDTGYAATTDKEVVGQAKFRSNLFVEYRLPWLHGLTLNMNWHHTGKRAANDRNTLWVDGYHTVDLGARFTTRLFDERIPVTWRLDANNVGNTFYWASIFAGSTDGVISSSASNSAFLGPTRTYMASMQVGF